MKTKLTLLIAVIVTLSGCANMASLDAPNPTVSSPSSASANQSASGTAATLRTVYSRYEGVPYRYGGTTANGFDCSGFIGVAMSEAFQLRLPRTTEDMMRSGQPIHRNQLQPGDLVFFKTSVKQLHAGIYIGDGAFIHASTSKGVTTSSLNNAYWQERYLQARRVI